MSRFRKTIIISVAVLAVLGAAVAALMLIPDAGDEAEASPSPSVSASSAPALISESRDNIKNVVFTPAQGKSFTILPVESTCDVAVKSDVFPYLSSSLSTMMSYAISQTSATLITENATSAQLTEFGFDAPALNWKVNRKDGTFLELQLGNANATKTSYYARLKGSSAVYTISSYSAGYLLKAEHDYYDLTFAPTYTDADSQTVTIQNTLSYVSFVKPDGTPIEAKRRTGEELEASELISSSFLLLEPYQGSANDYFVTDILGAKIATISPSKVIEQNPADLSQYGLDNPIRLELEDTEGWTGVLLIGSSGPEFLGRYVMFEGSSCVFLDT